MELEKEYGYELPNQYKTFLYEQNGLSYDGGTILYSIDELKVVNDDMEIQEYLEDYIAVGDDGAGLVFLMKQDKNATEVVCVEISDYNIDEPYCLISDFYIWYKNGCILEEKKENEYGKEGKIYLLKVPEKGTKELIIIKKAFSLDISTAQLLSLTKQVPCVIVEQIKYAKAIKIMEQINLGDVLEFRVGIS